MMTTTEKTRTENRSTKSDCPVIASDRVEGTEIYGKDGTKLGTVRKMMIDKKSGQVRNVVVGYGGLFGMGEDHYPMPWDSLRYDEDQGGYVIQSDKSLLNRDKAPSYKADQEPSWDEGYEREVRLYYFPA